MRIAQSYRLGPIISLIERTTGLDDNQAKTVAYWAVATHGLEKLGIFPILVFKGPPSTGKSTLLDVLGQLAYKPRRLDGKVTKAVLRDSFEPNTTAIVEEADKVYEPLILARYARTTSGTSVNRKAPGEWKREHLDQFGATALHRRVPFRDVAVASRSIEIRTRRVPTVSRYQAEDFMGHKEEVTRLGQAMDWANAPTEEAGRSIDTWKPLLALAKWLEDTDWLDYAASQMTKADANLQAGQEEEPAELTFQALLALAVGVAAGEAKARVLVADVVKNLEERGQTLNSWQVGQMLRDMGFEGAKKGGNQYVYTGGAEKLKAVGHQLGIHDEWLTETVG